MEVRTLNLLQVIVVRGQRSGKSLRRVSSRIRKTVSLVAVGFCRRVRFLHPRAEILVTLPTLKESPKHPKEVPHGAWPWAWSGMQGWQSSSGGGWGQRQPHRDTHVVERGNKITKDHQGLQGKQEVTEHRAANPDSARFAVRDAGCSTMFPETRSDSSETHRQQVVKGQFRGEQ